MAISATLRRRIEKLERLCPPVTQKLVPMPREIRMALRALMPDDASFLELIERVKREGIKSVDNVHRLAREVVESRQAMKPSLPTRGIVPPTPEMQENAETPKPPEPPKPETRRMTPEELKRLFLSDPNHPGLWEDDDE